MTNVNAAGLLLAACQEHVDTRDNCIFTLNYSSGTRLWLAQFSNSPAPMSFHSAGATADEAMATLLQELFA